MLGEPPQFSTFFFLQHQLLLFIERTGDVDEVHVLMRGFVFLGIGGNLLEQKTERLFENASFISVPGKDIGLRIAENVDIETRLLLALTFRGVLGELVWVHVSSGRHPTSQAVMPQEEAATFAVDDESRCGKVALHLPILPMVLIDDNSSVLQIGDPLPHFALPATDGVTVDTRMIKDTALVVVFTCNHCPYAQAYEDRLIALQQHFDADAQFILVSSNDAVQYPEDNFVAMQQRHDEKAFPFPYCYDESQEVATSFGALCTPHCFVFDRERTLRFKGTVDDSWKDASAVTAQYLKDAIEAVRKGETPNTPEANAIGCSIKWKT